MNKSRFGDQTLVSMVRLPDPRWVCAFSVLMYCAGMSDSQGRPDRSAGIGEGHSKMVTASAITSFTSFTNCSIIKFSTISTHHVSPS